MKEIIIFILITLWTSFIYLLPILALWIIILNAQKGNMYLELVAIILIFGLEMILISNT